MRGKNPSKQKTALTGINAVYNCFSFSSQFSTHIPMNLKYNRTFLMMENSLFSQSSKSPVVYSQSFLPTVSVIFPFVSSIQSSLQSVDIHPRSFSTYYKIMNKHILNMRMIKFKKHKHNGMQSSLIQVQNMDHSMILH